MKIKISELENYRTDLIGVRNLLDFLSTALTNDDNLTKFNCLLTNTPLYNEEFITSKRARMLIGLAYQIVNDKVNNLESFEIEV